MKKITYLIILMILSTLIISGCSKTETSPVSESEGDTKGDEKGVSAGGGAASVIIKGFSFVPQEIRVKPGTTITWRNEDSDAHTVESTDGFLTSDTLEQGDTVTFTFDKLGKVDYICGLHPSMKGAVIVE